ncbi:MAG: isoprenylcysteine carboxylmethyltransferase family protein [Thiovulaceae bacterium]|nr:isoprenylcysteine carboxylmethyltransferase family protein [Sulfurimonadaceae bacterium]
MYSRALVFAQFSLIGLMALYSSEIFHSISAMAVLALGICFGIWAIMHNRLGNFNIRPELKEGCALVMSGPYRLVRHPMYTSVMLIALAMAIGTPILLEWISFLFLTMVLAVKAEREERLWCVENSAYESYMKETKRFLPYIY